MVQLPPPNVTPHETAKFWLDVSDKVLKAIAVVVAAAWTWMNYRRSRTYAQKLDLQLIGDIFFKNGLYIDIAIAVVNLGAARHVLQPEGSLCDLVLVHADLSEESVRIFFPLFPLHTQIEPGESISDHLLWRIEPFPPDIIWLKVNLRLVSGKVEWNRTLMVRIDDGTAKR
jgi:hypothetical protein